VEIVENILLVLHFVGIGALFSGFFYQLKQWGEGMKVNAGILHGAWLMLATGLGMIGILQMPGSDEQVNNLVLVAKSIVITAVFFVAYTYNKKEKTPTWVVPTIAGLTTLNIVFAVVWGIVIHS
jgi:hypothetical protein